MSSWKSGEFQEQGNKGDDLVAVASSIRQRAGKQRVNTCSSTALEMALEPLDTPSSATTTSMPPSEEDDELEFVRRNPVHVLKQAIQVDEIRPNALDFLNAPLAVIGKDDNALPPKNMLEMAEFIQALQYIAKKSALPVTAYEFLLGVATDVDGDVLSKRAITPIVFPFLLPYLLERAAMQQQKSSTEKYQEEPAIRTGNTETFVNATENMRRQALKRVLQKKQKNQIQTMVVTGIVILIAISRYWNMFKSQTF